MRKPQMTVVRGKSAYFRDSTLHDNKVRVVDI